ncbi:MAG: DUF2889 domain-containing protein [Spirochaetes bacterium]|nr:DUF2889 domain-containing protein [Spirochaetota bacterium]
MRPQPIYDRKKCTRTWFKEGFIYVETWLEDSVHFIKLNLTINKNDLSITNIDIAFMRSPYPDICSLTDKIYKKIIGLEIKPGFNQRIKERIPSDQGCLHVSSLLKEAGDAIVQTKFHMNTDIALLEGEERRKLLKNQENLKNICLAYSDQYTKH